MNAVIPALTLYKYRSASDYYANGDILYGGNWWSRGNKTLHYGNMIMFGLTFLTQFLTVLGEGANWNMTTWAFLIGIFNPIFNLIFVIFQLIAKYQALEMAHDETNDASKIAQATLLASSVESDIMNYTIGVVSNAVILLWHADNWIAG